MNVHVYVLERENVCRRLNNKVGIMSTSQRPPLAHPSPHGTGSSRDRSIMSYNNSCLHSVSIYVYVQVVLYIYIYIAMCVYVSLAMYVYIYIASRYGETAVSLLTQYNDCLKSEHTMFTLK